MLNQQQVQEMARRAAHDIYEMAHVSETMHCPSQFIMETAICSTICTVMLEHGEAIPWKFQTRSGS